MKAIVKLGGSVITQKNEWFKANLATIDRLANELSDFKGEVVVVHGGGSYGHPVVLKYGVGLSSEREKYGSVKAKLAMRKLNVIVSVALLKHGLLPYSLPPDCVFEVSNKSVVKVNRKKIAELLELGVTPVLHGDVVPDESLGFTVLSGDDIACRLAKVLRARKLIFCMDVDGLFTDDPRRNPLAKLITEISFDELEEIAKKMSPGRDATSGIYGKLTSILRLKGVRGLKVYLINGNRPGLLKTALVGEPFPATAIY